MCLVLAIGFFSIMAKAIQDKFEGIPSNRSSFEEILSNGSILAHSKEDGFAEIIHGALEKEFSNKDRPDGKSNISNNCNFLFI